jgi:hypothetical protein
MDGLFKLLWPLSNLGGPSITIPTYRQGENEDLIDLQIKSLMYMFRRCNIAHLEQFRSDSPINKKRSMASMAAAAQTSRNAMTKHGGISPMERDKLDIMYNKSQFEKVLADDEHRVLVDWTKNRFRSMCILSGRPNELDNLPQFDISNFHFVVLPPDSSDDDYIRTLSLSDLYIEHPLSGQIKNRLAKDAVHQIRAASNKLQLNKDDRAKIIKKYLATLAVEVQVERLYRATLRARKIAEELDNPVASSINNLNKKMSNMSLSPCSSPERTPKVNAKQGSKLSSYPSLPALNISVNSRSTVRSRGRDSSPDRHQFSPTSRSRSRITTRDRSSTRDNSFFSKENQSSTVRQKPIREQSSMVTPNRSEPQLRSKTSSSMLHSGPKLNPTALVTSDGISPTERREIIEQSRIAVRNRIDREKSLMGH